MTCIDTTILRKPPLDTDRKHIEDLIFKQHLSDIEIAKIFGVTKDTIWSRRKLWKLPSGSELREQKLQEEITKLWQEGYLVDEIAEVLQVTVQLVYTKMRIYNIRDLPRMGFQSPFLSLTEVKNRITSPEVADQVVIVTHNRQPKWALVPIEEYQDLVNGVWSELREE